jgi:hypothetical protein
VTKYAVANGRKSGVDNNSAGHVAAEEAVAIITKAENGTAEEQNETRV